MKRICILSDTHGLLREEVKAGLAATDIILHAGDIDNGAVLQILRQYGELYAVRGNNDRFSAALPEILFISIEGIRFCLLHNKKDIPQLPKDTDIVVYGHTHKYESVVSGGILYLNPGSCGKRRFHNALTYCRMVIDGGGYHYDKIVIDNI